MISILILLLFGLTISIFLIFKERRERKIKICNESCSPVLTSQYTKILGIKNTYLGVIFFSILILLQIINLWQEYLITSIILIFGSIHAIYLIYIQKIKIKHFCKYCITTELIVFTLTIIHFSIK